MSVALPELSARNGFNLRDPRMAAEFSSLILSIPLDRAMLVGNEHGFTETAIDQHADEGVRVFLRAYASP